MIKSILTYSELLLNDRVGVVILIAESNPLLRLDIVDKLDKCGIKWSTIQLRGTDYITLSVLDANRLPQDVIDQVKGFDIETGSGGFFMLYLKREPVELITFYNPGPYCECPKTPEDLYKMSEKEAMEYITKQAWTLDEAEFLRYSILVGVFDSYSPSVLLGAENLWSILSTRLEDALRGKPLKILF